MTTSGFDHARRRVSAAHVAHRSRDEPVEAGAERFPATSPVVCSVHRRSA
ncbi:hypothetical protein AB0H12_30065 [Actinosynnema sp. NPDC023794]